jgi:hypothetical protein
MSSDKKKEPECLNATERENLQAQYKEVYVLKYEENMVSDVLLLGLEEEKRRNFEVVFC